VHCILCFCWGTNKEFCPKPIINVSSVFGLMLGERQKRMEK